MAPRKKGPKVPVPPPPRGICTRSTRANNASAVNIDVDTIVDDIEKGTVDNAPAADADAIIAATTQQVDDDVTADDAADNADDDDDDADDSDADDDDDAADDRSNLKVCTQCI